MVYFLSDRAAVLQRFRDEEFPVQPAGVRVWNNRRRAEHAAARSGLRVFGLLAAWDPDCQPGPDGGDPGVLQAPALIIWIPDLSGPARLQPAQLGDLRRFWG